MAGVWSPRGLITEEKAPFEMPPLIWKWLSSRGVTQDEAIKEFFSPKLAGLTHPFKLAGMDLAVERLKRAHAQSENVCVYGDYDLDGSSGIAVLVRGLQLLGFKGVTFYQPSRFLEGYGIHGEALRTIAQNSAKVVISVDCGITAVDEAKIARDLGLDLIITDHHLPLRGSDEKEVLPDALAIINPNQEACASGLGHLSGVGVGFYFLMGLKIGLEAKCDLKELLDLFTLGTITDMVPLQRENRVLVKHGLEVLSRTPRPGLRSLLKKLGLWQKKLESQDVAFSLAPKLNALSRLELGVRPLQVFMCEDEKKGAELAEEVVLLNQKRKSLQADLEEKILSLLEKEASERAVILAAPGHAGVVSLVATKVCQLTEKPTFIVALHGSEGIGSARGPEGCHLPNALARCAPFLERFGGHAQAAGFSLRPENFEGFKRGLLDYYRQVSKNQNALLREYYYDTEAKIFEMDQSFMNWLRHAGPFGSENPTPLFRLRNVKVSQVRWLKDLHLKVQLVQENYECDGISFFARGQFNVEKGQIVELLGEPQWNEFRGQKRLQLIIRDLKTI